MDTRPESEKGTGVKRAGLIRPLPIFVIVTALAAVVSGLPVIRELTGSFTSPSYGRVSFVIHLLLPPAVGLLAALGVHYAVGTKKSSVQPAGLPAVDLTGTLDSDERARAIQRTLPMVLVCLSPAGRVTFLNPAAYALFGSDAVRPGGTLESFLQEAGMSRLIARTSRGETFQVEEVIYSGDRFADAVTLRVTGIPIHRNKEIAELLLVMEDISAVKQLEDELIRSEERYRNIFNHAHCGIFFVDRNGNYVDANPAALRMLGYSLDELTRLNTREISSGSSPRIRRLLESPGTVVEETRYMRKDGRVVDAELAASSYRSAGEIYFIGIITEISRRKRLERDVADLRASLSLFVSEMPGAVVLLAADGTVLDLNDAAATVLGSTRPLRQDLSFSELIGGDDHTGKGPEPGGSMEVTLENGRKVTFRCRAVHTSGPDRPCRLLEISGEPEEAEKPKREGEGRTG